MNLNENQSIPALLENINHSFRNQQMINRLQSSMSKINWFMNLYLISFVYHVKKHLESQFSHFNSSITSMETQLRDCSMKLESQQDISATLRVQLNNTKALLERRITEQQKELETQKQIISIQSDSIAKLNKLQLFRQRYSASFRDIMVAVFSLLVLRVELVQDGVNFLSHGLTSRRSLARKFRQAMNLALFFGIARHIQKGMQSLGFNSNSGSAFDRFWLK